MTNVGPPSVNDWPCGRWSVKAKPGLRSGGAIKARARPIVVQPNPIGQNRRRRHARPSARLFVRPRSAARPQRAGAGEELAGQLLRGGAVGRDQREGEMVEDERLVVHDRRTTAASSASSRVRSKIGASEAEAEELDSGVADDAGEDVARRRMTTQNEAPASATTNGTPNSSSATHTGSRSIDAHQRGADLRPAAPARQCAAPTATTRSQIQVSNRNASASKSSSARGRFPRRSTQPPREFTTP